jgi:Uncharacterized protein conserved in bacteria (DUF2325)
MRIGIIGGAERVEVQYQRAAQSAGHELEFHPGHMSSRGAASLERLVRRCDVIVIVTEVNSHAAVQRARGLARSQGRTPVLCRRFGVQALLALMESQTALSA